jgi:2-keto-4-pentenoate hydratase/2-oxohepta-3-ene-1,7-dioic acid hydratase in catechol pathway
MNLATFLLGDRTSYGVKTDSGVIDVSEITKAAGLSLPATLLDLVQAGEEALRLLRSAVVNYQGPYLRLDEVAYLAPILRPGKILCLALNNSANASRILSGPQTPAFFSKPATALAGHGTAIQLRDVYGRVHPEPELAVIIGRKGKEIAAEKALDHVFGYTIHNDLTSPTMREEDTYHYRAIHPDGAGGIRYVETHVSYPGRYKGSDGFAPMGPWIVTRDAVPNPHALEITCWHDGELITRDNTVNLTHHLPAVIAHISQFMTLEPGDIISLGTALSAAQANGTAIQNIDLNLLGGTVSVSIDGIGTLTNSVAR